MAPSPNTRAGAVYKDAIGDLRQYVDALQALGEVNVVEKEVDPQFELAAVISRSQKESDRPILFRNVKGSRFPVIANVYGSFTRLAGLLGTGSETLNDRWIELLDTLSECSADYINEVASPADLNSTSLTDLPSIFYREKDAGPYITAGVFLAKDPETGIPNLSFCRCLLLGGNEQLVCCIDPPHDLARYQEKAEKKGEALEVAILIGAPPAVFLAAVASLAIEQDELQLAAHINGGSLDMRRCETLDLLVPAATEVVIEASIRPNERSTDGPFGEYLGYYSGLNEAAYVVDVHHVSNRKNAYYQSLLCGSREDLTVLAVSWGGRILQKLVAEISGVIDMTISPTVFSSIVKIDKQYDNHAKDVIDAVFRINPLYNRMCIVVDADIDIHDLESVWWAFLTRGDLDTRTHLMSNLPGVEQSNYLFSGYLGIDATMSLGSPQTRATTPGESTLNLHEYFV